MMENQGNVRKSINDFDNIIMCTGRSFTASETQSLTAGAHDKLSMSSKRGLKRNARFGMSTACSVRHQARTASHPLQLNCRRDRNADPQPNNVSHGKWVVVHQTKGRVPHVGEMQTQSSVHAFSITVFLTGAKLQVLSMRHIIQ